jgi:hypothetical protein
MRSARRESGERLWFGDMKARAKRILAQREALLVGIIMGFLLALMARMGQAFLNNS